MNIVPGARKSLELLSSGRFADIGTKIVDRLRSGPYGTHLGYGLRRDLQVPLVAPKAKIPIEIRELRDSDVPLLLPQGADASSKERWQVEWRREVVALGLPTCYVAVDQRTDAPCFMLWLTGSEHNARLAEVGPFPKLQSNEALLENAYTPAAYRGMGIMSAAMALIAERAAEFGARYVMTFVDDDNIASLKGCEKAGFSPYIIRRQAQYAFGLVRTVAFAPYAKPSDARQTAA